MEIITNEIENEINVILNIYIVSIIKHKAR